MRINELITLFFALFIGSVNAFQMKPTNCPNLKSSNSAPLPIVQSPRQDALQTLKSNYVKVLPALVALSVSTPAWAAKAAPAPEMSASFLPAIFVPVVGIVFPAFSMALFFLYVENDDLEQI
mmetsp:Transcript_19690/g.23502  ORF Transcript_19690/g.23502 Transcript_19690/m.23502 type:complete len:122 (-) Transcript_19690:248-613(-)